MISPAQCLAMLVVLGTRARGNLFEAPAPAEAPAAVRLRAVRVQSNVLELAALRDELAIRLPHAAIDPHRAELAAPDEPFAWVDVRPRPGDESGYEIAVVVSDGRGYMRHIAAIEVDPERELATSIANLLIAIEDGTVVPDVAMASIPPPPAGEPRRPEPAAKPRSSRPVPKRPAVARDLPTIAIVPAFDAVIGLGQPKDVDRLAAIGGSLGIMARARRGGTFAFDVRIAGRGHESSLGLLRTRFAVGGGYVLVHKRLEVDVLALGSVEPWWLLDGEASPRPRPLIGLAARLGAGYRLVARNSVVRLGPRLELAVAGVPQDGVRVAKVSLAGEPMNDPIFRIGGVELTFGADIAFWFEVGSKREP